MPQRKKVTWSQLRVGLLAMVAMSILGYLIFLLTGEHGLFRSRTYVYTYMGDAAALTRGAPVMVNGISVGQVRDVALSGSNDPLRIVKISMEVDSNFLGAIPVDSKAQVSAANLLGTKFINIKKGVSPQTVQPGAEIPSLDTTGFDDVVQQGYSALASLDGILKKADGILATVEVGQGTIGKLLVDETLYNKVLAIANEAQKMTKSVTDTINSDQGTIGKLLHEDKLYQEVRGTVARMNNLMDGLDQGQGSAGKFLKDPALYDDAVKTVSDVRRLLADVDQGKGTIGKLLKNDELHNQIKGTIARLDTLLDKINSGQGTLGQLVANPALYESLDGTTRELHGLLKDFRSNPKKFLRIKLGLF
jgi:phospholipid/cholesterol/gamma-HCH transport system substrate-binding protein